MWCIFMANALHDRAQWIETAQRISRDVVRAHEGGRRTSAAPLTDWGVVALAVDLKRIKCRSDVREASRPAFHSRDVLKHLSVIEAALEDLADAVAVPTGEDKLKITTRKKGSEPDLVTSKYDFRKVAISRFLGESYRHNIDEDGATRSSGQAAHTSDERETRSVRDWLKQLPNIIVTMSALAERFERLSNHENHPDDEILSDPLIRMDYKSVLAGKVLRHLYQRYFPNGKRIGGGEESAPSGELIFIQTALLALGYEPVSAATVRTHSAAIRRAIRRK